MTENNNDTNIKLLNTLYLPSYKNNFFTDQPSPVSYSIAIQEIDEKKYVFHIYEKGCAVEDMPVICDSEGNPIIYTFRSQESISDMMLYRNLPKNTDSGDTVLLKNTSSDENKKTPDYTPDDTTKIIGRAVSNATDKAKDALSNTPYVDPSEDPRFTEYDVAHFGKSEYNAFGEHKSEVSEATRAIDPEEAKKLLSINQEDINKPSTEYIKDKLTAPKEQLSIQYAPDIKELPKNEPSTSIESINKNLDQINYILDNIIYDKIHVINTNLDSIINNIKSLKSLSLNNNNESNYKSHFQTIMELLSVGDIIDVYLDHIGSYPFKCVYADKNKKYLLCQNDLGKRFDWGDACNSSWTAVIDNKIISNVKIPTYYQLLEVDPKYRPTGFYYWTSTKYDDNTGYYVTAIGNMIDASFSIMYAAIPLIVYNMKDNSTM